MDDVQNDKIVVIYRTQFNTVLVVTKLNMERGAKKILKYFSSQVFNDLLPSKKKVMRFTLLLFCFLIQFISNGQVSITSADMPNSGDILIQENANWMGNWDLEESGANLSWSLNTSNITPLGVSTSTECLAMSGASFVYQFLFGSPFDQEHNSSYFTATELPQLPLDQLPLPIPITLEDAYAFYQNRSDRFALTGFGLTISSLPTGASGEPVDVIYPLPLTYGLDEVSESFFNYVIPTLGSYSTSQVRRTQVLAYGTMNFFGTNYPVIKVKSTINADDVLTVDQFGLSLPFSRPEVAEYKWLTPGIKVPLLQINTTQGTTTNTLIYASAPIGVNETAHSDWTVYPNPGEVINIKSNDSAMITILDEKGSVVFKDNLNALSGFDAKGLANGTYFIEINGSVKKWIKN